jgi:glycosyltransferase involved in cell wall biosynthesis
MRHLVLLSYRAHPFGGGEEDCHDKAAWARAAGWEVTWLAFARGQGDAHTSRETTVEHTEDGQVRLVAQEPASREALHRMLAALRPTVVLAIGRMITHMAGFLTCPWVAAFHFWTALVDLGPTGNIGVRAAAVAGDARVAEEFPAIAASAAAVAVVSPFMQDVCLALRPAPVTVPYILQSSPPARSVCTAPYDPAAPDRTWVLMVNGHHLKGGALLPTLIAEHKGLPLRVVLTEADTGPAGTQLAAGLVSALCARNGTTDARVQVLNRQPDLRALLAQARLVVCASVVDETFGRVAAEAMASGVPVVLSRRGNLPYLGGAHAAYVDPSDVPRACADIAALYADAPRLQALSEYYRRRAERVCAERVRPVFLGMLEDVARRGPASTLPAASPRVMFFAPWHDQGLGTQTRAYCRVLEAAGVSTCVCSFSPYVTAGAGETIEDKLWQQAPLEWVHPRVYYSPHPREAVTDAEVVACLRAFAPTRAVIPETCWYRVFQVARLCVEHGVPCYGVPNIELVRSDELAAHREFTGLLANNRLCERVMATHGLAATHVGFALPDDDTVVVGGGGGGGGLEFLLIGGANVDGRKQGPAIVAAFASAVASAVPSAVGGGPRFTLTITAQTTASAERTIAAARGVPGVHVSVGNVAHADIGALYARADATIMPSKHEGLGMGFYEALQRGCPVVTVDAPPHNEIIVHRTNGWLLRGAEVPLVENPASLVCSVDVDTRDLRQWFAWAMGDPGAVRDMRAAAVADYATRLAPTDFARRLCAAMDMALPEPPQKPPREPEPEPELEPEPEVAARARAVARHLMLRAPAGGAGRPLIRPHVSALGLRPRPARRPFS